MTRSSNISNIGTSEIRFFCPSCHSHALLEDTQTHDIAGNDLNGWAFAAGIRRCPNTDCQQVIYVLYDRSSANKKVKESYPPESLQIDSSNLPSEVSSSIEEAARCFQAQSFRGAMAMLRRTLEALCEDRDAVGNNLKERLDDIKQRLSIPLPLVDSLGDLRLLGNDATHIEMKTFSGMGQEETRVAFDITLEILKGVYQYDALVQRLQGLKA